MQVDFDTNRGPELRPHARISRCTKPTANHLQKDEVVLRFDNDRFFKLYVDLPPVPVRMP
jgi:hypothetical protein